MEIMKWGLFVFSLTIVFTLLVIRRDRKKIDYLTKLEEKQQDQIRKLIGEIDE